MKQNNYLKGSEWRKWDLHVHTPYSIVNHYRGKDNDEKWEKFLSDLENLPAEFKVLGINDYLFIDGYRKMLEYKEKGRLKNIELLLPVVEFRIEKFAGHKEFKKVNFHVIFSDELSPDIIQKQFLDAITNHFKLTPGINGIMWSGVISKESLEDLGKKIKESVPKDKLAGYGSDLEEGFNNLCFDEDYILKHLENNTFLKDKYLIAIGKTEWESLSWNDQSIAIKKDIINKADIVFISAKNIKDFENAKAKLEEQKVNNLLLDCSDAHYNSDSQEKDRIGKCFTWIKADPTFEGLKQIIYEPEERVRIQENNPQNDYPKHYFSNIIIKETNIFDDSKVKFEQNEIELNPNLIAIIGGRGTGKSLLLDAIAKTLKKVDGNARSKNISIKKDDFSVTYTKSDNTNEKYNIQEENIVDYLHIHQGYVKAIVNPENSSKLDKEIKELLNLKEKPQITYDESFLSRLIDEIFEIRDFLNKVDDNGEKINSKEYIEKQQKQKKTLIENITTEENKELISKYTDNIKTINDLSKKIQQLEDLKRDLKQFQSDKNNLIKEINQLVDDKNKIPEISFNEQIQKIDILNEYHKNEKKNKEVENQSIKENFKNKGISGDITTLLEQTKKYQEDIDALENKKKLIEDKEKNLKEKFDKIKEVIDDISKSYRNFEEDINNKWSNLKKGKEDWTENQKDLVNKLLKDIDIEFTEKFDEDKFYEKIQETLNLSKFRATISKSQNERIKEAFNINSKDDFILFLKNEKKVLSNEEEMNLSEFINSEYFVKDGAKEFLRLMLLNYSDFWQVITKPKYKNKELSQLSVGMKGTMYLCLKLATDPFMKPFIFDQPEDDLDNNFIVNELVPIFRTIKKYRQVIIVTHNANLVVNADAEQVIVAENENESINYITGSLENINIRNKVCEILEGGIDAFRKREKKYNIKI